MLTLFHPRHTRCAVAVGGGVAGGHIVGARQVVIRQGLQVDLVVVLVALAAKAWILEERASDEEMRAGEYPLLGAIREASLPLDGAILLGVGFVPHFQ